VGVKRQNKMIEVLKELAFERQTGGEKQVHNGYHRDRKCPNPLNKTLQNCKTSVRKCIKALMGNQGPKKRSADDIVVPKDSVKENINNFCGAINNKSMSLKQGESTYQSTSGYGSSGGFRRHRRSPPTQFVTTSVSWTKDKGCDTFSWKINEDICKQGLTDALNACDGNDTAGGTSTM
jgi:hypothetical protein